MDKRVNPQRFSPDDLDVLAAWAPELADTFVALSCDLALVIDGQGRILSMAQHEAAPIAPQAWIGCPWVETVTPGRAARWKRCWPRCRAPAWPRRDQPCGGDGGRHRATTWPRRASNPSLAVGHDLRRSGLQQRFVAAQEALERADTGTRTNTSGCGCRTGPDDRRGPEIPVLQVPVLPAPRTATTGLLRGLGQLVEHIGQNELVGAAARRAQPGRKPLPGACDVACRRRRRVAGWLGVGRRTVARREFRPAL